MPARGAEHPPLRDVRRARGLGLREVARRVGIDAAHLSRIERGYVTPSVGLLARLADVLELRELAKLLGPYAAIATAKTRRHRPRRTDGSSSL